MKTQVIEGPKELLAEQVARITGRIVRAIVFIDEPANAADGSAKPSGDPWMEAFQQTLDSAVVVGQDVNDSRESIYRGRGE